MGSHDGCFEEGVHFVLSVFSNEAFLSVAELLVVAEEVEVLL